MSNHNETGIGVLGLLGVLLVGLKVAHITDLSWIWVTLPFWGTLALFVVVMILAFIMYLLSMCGIKVSNYFRKNKVKS